MFIMFKFLLLLFILQVFGVFSHPRPRRDTNRNDVSRQLELQGYANFISKKENDQDVKDYILEVFSKWDAQERPANVTIIGWQAILNEDGAVDEVRTIELGFLGNHAYSTDVTDEFNYITGSDTYLMINDVVHYANDVQAETGLEIVRSLQLYNYYEELELGMFLDSRDVYFPISTEIEEQAYLVRNLTAKSLDDVKQFMEENQGSLPSSLLVYDDWETESINLSESVIVPEQLVTLTDVENATVSMVEDAAKYIATAYLVDSANAAEYVRSNMTEAYPDNKWLVTEDLQNYYVSRDILMLFTFSDVPMTIRFATVQLFGIAK